MSAERFTLDTNILIYALDIRAGIRRHLADRIIGLALKRDCHLTLQAVSEFYAAMVRKRLVPTAEAAAQAEDWLSLFPIVAASPDGVRHAVRLASSGRASYRDALLIATAAEAECKAILTEDLADGTDLLGVRIIHPFAGDSLSPAAATLLRAT